MTSNQAIKRILKADPESIVIVCGRLRKTTLVKDLVGRLGRSRCLVADHSMKALSDLVADRKFALVTFPVEESELPDVLTRISEAREYAGVWVLQMQSRPTSLPSNLALGDFHVYELDFDAKWPEAPNA